MREVHLKQDVYLSVPKGTDILVTYYQREDYDGSGYAIAIKNNKFAHKGLSHCSCYHPDDNDWSEFDSYIGDVVNGNKDVFGFPQVGNFGEIENWLYNKYKKYIYCREGD